MPSTSPDSSLFRASMIIISYPGDNYVDTFARLVSSSVSEAYMQLLARMRLIPAKVAEFLRALLPSFDPLDGERDGEDVAY